MSKKPQFATNFQEYFKEIRARYLTGDYTELSLRTPLENFVRSLNKDYGLIQEPKRTRNLGAPDFKAFNGIKKIGYIETKDLNRNLDEELKSDQIEKYRKSIDNIILTNYFRFILLKHDKILFDFNLFNLSDLDDSKFIVQDRNIEKYLSLISVFFGYNLTTLKTPEELSFELSKRAKLLKDLAKEQLNEDILKAKDNQPASSIYDFYVGAKELIHDISVDDCADAYAQTIAYGLFLARMNSTLNLDRNNAASFIPRSIGVIKKIFLNISGDAVPSSVSWIIDEIVEIMNASDMNNIISTIDARGKTDRDPFTFFYEDFLSAFDPEKKKHLGVYYTPRPVVHFIVNSIDLILQNDFGKSGGFTEDDVTVLDPAVGTGTFLWLIYTLTLVKLKNSGMSGLIRKKIENHILKDFYGIEILITPYIIAHLKLSMVLKKWFYEVKDTERSQVYLANTLEPFVSHGLMAFMREISEESRIANELKLKRRVLVITGNPPYHGMSANKGEWIRNLLKNGYVLKSGIEDFGYSSVDGHPLGEKNPKWLQNDYVKFIRFAQWKMDVAGEGIIGFITNHGYLDNPTFRGMRQSLLKSFDAIYVLNLHGSVLRNKKRANMEKDENVFDIRPGVAISIFIKKSDAKTKGIFYAELYGKREEKFEWLDRHTIANTNWKKLEPCSPSYFFVPKDQTLLKEYSRFTGLERIFNKNSLSIQTHRDSFAIDFDEEKLAKKINSFGDLKIADDLLRRSFSIDDTSSWKMTEARKIVSEIQNPSDYLKKFLYRPFDRRWLFYHQSVVDRTRKDIMKHMSKSNMALLVSKQLSSPSFKHVFISDCMTDAHVVSNRTKEGNYHFPLYLYEDDGTKRLNINEKIISFLTKTYGIAPTPEELFHYVYAILHSNNYRKRYYEFLQSDFPKIPFAENYEEFKELVEIGKTLVDLHLLKNKLTSEIKFDVQGSNLVDFVEFKAGRVYINSEQFFEGVSENVWNYYVGCYRVVDKWLKDKKGRELSNNEIEGFIQVAEAINQTLMNMERIDLIPFVELNFSTNCCSEI